MLCYASCVDVTSALECGENVNSQQSAEIARRVLTSPRGDIEILLYAPEFVTQNEYKCSYRIRGGDIDEREWGVGVDSMQALYSALEKIRQKLKPMANQLNWLGDAAPDTSFPQIVLQGIGPDYALHLEKVIEREHVAKLVELRAKTTKE